MMNGSGSTNHSRVKTDRHRPDFDDLFEQVFARAPEANALGFVFINPLVTVQCEQPTPEFFKLVRQRQAEWCKQARTLFPRSMRKRVSKWLTPLGEETKLERLGTRSILFTGSLYANGNFVPAHEWNRWEHGNAFSPKMSARRTRQTRHEIADGKADESELLRD